MDDSTKNLIQDHIDTNEVCLFMKEMYENGELKKVLEDKGINFKK